MIKSALTKLISNELGQEVALQNGARFGNFFISPSEAIGLVERLDLSLDDLTQKILKAIQNKAEKVLAEGGYINIYLKKETILDELEQLLRHPESVLQVPEAKDKTIVFDYSGPNIAKPFSVGHLRSTVIGQANYNIHKALGYNTIGVNHLGDWGTQFGKLIYAIKTWGDEKKIAEDPIRQLNALYVKFHIEAQTDESLNDVARAWFKKLEDGDSEAREIWKKCVAWSITEFDRIYEILGVKIDNVQGESFYTSRLQDTITELDQKGLLVKSEGAKIVELDSLPPALIQKKDEATLYLTRDLAALKYRIENYHPVEIIYHIGNDQSLHFQQLKAVATKLGWLDGVKITFAGHGLIRLETGKMSTRKGQVILLDDLVSEAKQKSLDIINQKNPDLKNIEQVALSIAISAIKYADLVQNRKSDIVFSFNKVVTLRGNSGPYLQYTYARASSILRKFSKMYGDTEPVGFIPEEAGELARHLLGIKDALIQSAHTSSPNIICDFTYKLCEFFNSYYEKKKLVTKDKDESAGNIYLVLAVRQTMQILFKLLGIDKLEEI